MNKIKQLESRLQETTGLLNKYESLLSKEPDDLSHKISLKTIEKHVDELQSQLRIEKSIREKEVILLRLKGMQAKRGSIPLSVLSDISKNLYEAILSTSQLIQKGERLRGKISKTIVESIDLRFAGIGVGSTCIYLTGNLSPDLFGHSLLENSLKNTFALLNSREADQLTENISHVGIRSAKKINEFLKTLSSSELEAEILWTAPTDKQYKWNGDKDAILTISNAFEKIKSERPEEIKFQGELIMGSTKGKFEIKDFEDSIYRGTFPVNILEEIKKLHIGEQCKGIIVKKTIINQVTGYKKVYYVLKSITPLKIRKI